MNKNPSVKRFIKSEGGMDQYECGLKYIGGHNPDLVLKDAEGSEVERIDLTQYKSQEELHNLFAEKVAKKPAAAAEGSVVKDEA